MTLDIKKPLMECRSRKGSLFEIVQRLLQRPSVRWIQDTHSEHDRFFDELNDEMATDLLLSSTLEAMNQRMAEVRQGGRSGWLSTSASNAELYDALVKKVNSSEELIDQIDDIINLAAMIRLRHIVYGERA